MAADEGVTVYLPCDIVEFRATIDVGPGVSPIEEITLQALAARPVSVGELAAFLALPVPVVSDIAHTLWRLGYLAVEPDGGRLVISQAASAAVTAGRTASLGAARREQRILELMLDSFLGQALRPDGLTQAPSAQAVDPPRPGADATDIPAADLLGAATLIARRPPGTSPDDNRAGENLTVLDLRREHARPRRRWRPVLVQPWLEELTGSLSVTVIDPVIPPAFREAGSVRLTGLVADNPGAPFAEWLRSRAMTGTSAVPTAESLAETLAERSARLPGLPPGQRIGHHRQLTDMTSELGQSLAAQVDTETVVELVTGARLAQTAVDLVDRSSVQVVVATSALSSAMAARLVPRLRAAMDRGVQIVLLWGDESNPPASLRKLSQLSSLAPLLLSRRTMSGQPGLVVCDDDAALMLGGSSFAADDTLGIALRAGDGGICPAVLALLSAISADAGDTAAEAILLRPSGRKTGAELIEATRTGQLPEAPPADDGDDAVDAVIAWQAAWAAYAAWQRETLKSRPLPQARLMTGASYPAMLGQALREARRRLVIASPSISDRTIDSQFLALLRRRLERGVMVTLAHRSSAGSGLAALEVLAAEFPGALFLSRAPAQARVIVWDDDAVLLSADPLATKHAHGRSLLGMRLTGPAIADLMASAAGEARMVTRQVTSVSATAGPDPELLARIRVLNTAQRVRNRWHEDRSIERALEALVAEEDPWPVLESLIGESGDDGRPTALARPAGELPDARGTGDELVCAAAAWCLTAHGASADAATADRWRQWLVHYHWRAGRFAEAALLRAGLPPEATPRASVAVVAAAFGTDVSTMALLTALEDEDLAPAELACLLCVAAAEALRTADDDHTEIVRKLVLGVAAPWGDLGAAVLTYGGAARGIPPELLIRPEADRSARSRRLAGAFDALTRAVDRAQQAQTGYASARRLQVALFKRSGAFGPLEIATIRRDVDAVRAFMLGYSAFNEPDDQTVSRILNQAWLELGMMEAQAGPARRALASRLVDILAAARAVLEAEEHMSRYQSEPAAAAHQEAAHVLTQQVRGLRTALSAAAVALGQPEASLVAHAIERIARMTEPEAL